MKSPMFRPFSINTLHQLVFKKPRKRIFSPMFTASCINTLHSIFLLKWMFYWTFHFILKYLKLLPGILMSFVMSQKAIFHFLLCLGTHITVLQAKGSKVAKARTFILPIHRIATHTIGAKQVLVLLVKFHGHSLVTVKFLSFQMKTRWKKFQKCL